MTLRQSMGNSRNHAKPMFQLLGAIVIASVNNNTCSISAHTHTHVCACVCVCLPIYTANTYTYMQNVRKQTVEREATVVVLLININNNIIFIPSTLDHPHVARVLCCDSLSIMTSLTATILASNTINSKPPNIPTS